MVIFEKELNWDLQEHNFLENLSEIHLLGGKYPIHLVIGKDANIISVELKAPIREIERNVRLELLFNNKEVKEVKVTSNEKDVNFNKYDLQSFYFEYVQSALFDLKIKRKSKFTIRNYRVLLNSSNINSSYKVNGCNKFIFGPLFEKHLDEPLTEQIIYFDVEVEANNIVTARSIVQNHVSDYSAYLSVLLDIGIDDIRSSYLTFVEKDIKGNLATKRRRTGFIDDNFDFIIKDNMNGIRTRKDVEENKISGFYNLSSGKGPINVVSGYVGDINLVDEQFKKHRLYKPKKNQAPEILEEKELGIMHLAGNPIVIPNCIGKYFKGIEALEKADFKKYEKFRNACRLYNLACIFHKYSPTAHIAYLTSAVEALGKTENKKFTPFVKENVQQFNQELLNFIYGKVRSGHFHSGEFPFMEYQVSLNNALQTDFFIAKKEFFEARQILRSAFINWIEINLIK